MSPLFTRRVSRCCGSETFEEWNRETGTAKLPERARPKANANSTPRKTAKRKSKVKRKGE